MDATPSAVESRKRRYKSALADLEALVENADEQSDVPDAVARCLDALYDLAELIKPSGRINEFDNLVAGDPGGETTLALVAARGDKTHRFVDFGDLHTFGSHGFGEGPFGGGWAWQTFDDPGPRFRRRVDWYASHVRGRLVQDPFRDAQRWIHDQLSPATEGER